MEPDPDELAARAGEEFVPEAFGATVEDALAGYFLVAVEDGGQELLAGGPVALPRLPEGGEDLPHLVDVDRRTVDRETLAEAAHVRLRGDAARAVADGDDERVATLLDVCYDLEAWGPVETDELRDRLDDAL